MTAGALRPSAAEAGLQIDGDCLEVEPRAKVSEKKAPATKTPKRRCEVTLATEGLLHADAAAGAGPELRSRR